MAVHALEPPQNHAWPKSVPQLKIFDDLLRCNICYDYLNTAMMTPCSHNYCSLCIRKFLVYKSKCPKCFEDTSEPLLRNNRLLDELIECYESFKNRLLNILRHSENFNAGEKNAVTNTILNFGASTSANTSAVQSSENDSGDSDFYSDIPPFKSPNSTKHDDPDTTFNQFEKTLYRTPKSENRLSTKNHLFQNSKSDVAACENNAENKLAGLDSRCLYASPSSVSKPDASPIVSSKTIYPMFSKITSPPPKTNALETNPVSRVSEQFLAAEGENSNVQGVKVCCPVCQVDIPERNINVHLDSCLRHPEQPDPPPRINQDRRKPLPKLVYDLLREKELRKKVKELGLNPQGDRKNLITRHQRFTILYNAECDKLHPRSVADLIREVEKEEKEERKINTSVVQGVKLNFDRKSDPKIIAQEQQQYLKHHGNHFEELIENIKKRQASKKDVPIQENNADAKEEEEPEDIPIIRSADSVLSNRSPELFDNFSSLSHNNSPSSSRESSAIPPSQIEPQDPESDDSVSMLVVEPDKNVNQFLPSLEKSSPELQNGLTENQEGVNANTEDAYTDFKIDFDLDADDFEEMKLNRRHSKRGRRRKLLSVTCEEGPKDGARVLRKRKKV